MALKMCSPGPTNYVEWANVGRETVKPTPLKREVRRWKTGKNQVGSRDTRSFRSKKEVMPGEIGMSNGDFDGVHEELEDNLE